MITIWIHAIHLNFTRSESLFSVFRYNVKIAIKKQQAIDIESQTILASTTAFNSPSPKIVALPMNQTTCTHILHSFSRFQKTCKPRVIKLFHIWYILNDVKMLNCWNMYWSRLWSLSLNVCCWLVEYLQ
jgi:hypothetical protein